jgi:CO/xanthine dehydrogenase FAD-binding subunit
MRRRNRGRKRADGREKRREKERRMTRFYTPAHLDEALDILESEGGKARVLAGGTDLCVQMRAGFKEPDVLVAITEIQELRGMEERNGEIRLGALTTHGEITNSELLSRTARPLVEAAAMVGSVQIRNVGTLGGNIANASPAGDTLPVLYILDAFLVIRKKGAERQVSVDDFITGPGETILDPGEIITEVRFAPLSPGENGCYDKIGRRKALSVAVVSVALRYRLTDDGRGFRFLRIAYGSVAPTIVRAKEAEALLLRSPLGPEDLEEGVSAAAAITSPIDDLRATARYRKLMAGRLLRARLLQILSP